MEDVFILTGLPTFGDHHKGTADALGDEGERLLALLREAMTKAKYASNKGTYLSWLTYFTKGAGLNSKVQLAAFFAYWLSYFVLPSSLDDWLNPFIFPMAVLLTQKNRSRWDRGFWALYTRGSTSVVITLLARSDVMTSFRTWRSTSSNCTSGRGSRSSPDPARVPLYPSEEVTWGK